jgi:hypothetical protein
MALTGHLSDLSLSELIEFFCNQRKTGCLKVRYPHGPGYFHLQTGSVVDAKIGVLRGIDAVYYALTLPNAAFEFSAAAEPAERTINQPWTQVVLEGLRRLDEGMVPPEAFPEGFAVEDKNVDATSIDDDDVPLFSRVSHVPSFLSMISRDSMSLRKSLIAGAAAVAVMVSVAAIGVPAGWYGGKQSTASLQPNKPVTSAAPATNDSATKPDPAAAEADSHAADAAAAAKRQREKEKAKARANTANGTESPKTVASTTPPNAGSDAASKSGPKKVLVQVTYDESGRVVQASGADPTALRIARQKRFPPGKAGTATITIPIN